jgi:hypothetical protein
MTINFEIIIIMKIDFRKNVSFKKLGRLVVKKNCSQPEKECGYRGRTSPTRAPNLLSGDLEEKISYRPH